MSSIRRQSSTLKHHTRRAEIIWVLKQEYPHLLTFRLLQLTLRDRNIPVSQNDLEGYLSYLEEGGYVRVERRFDEKESQDRIIAACLTGRGILLFDKTIEDPGVRF